MLNIGEVLDFEMEGFHNGQISKFKLSSYRGKWVILFFYPADFSFICPTEITEICENYDQLLDLETVVLSISTDPVYSHQTWHKQSVEIAKVKFPMLSDNDGMVAKQLGIFNQKKGFVERATLLLDPQGAIKSFEVCDDRIGRSFAETLRKLKALMYVYGNLNKNLGCPASWRPGEEGIKMEK